MTEAPFDPLAELASQSAVAQAADRARDAVDAVLRHRVLRRSFAAVTVECSLRSAVAAADLQDGREGRDYDDARAAVRSGALFTVPSPERLTVPSTVDTLRGAVRVSAELGTLQRAWESAPRQALARLHVLAAADRVAGDDLGRPRSGEPLAEGLDLGPAPDPGVLGQRLAGLADLVARPTAAPALVLAAVVHGELLSLRPFCWGNVLVALAAQRLVLSSRGVDPRAVTVAEAGHLELGVAVYRDAARGYASGAPSAVEAWVVHCARALEIGAREGLAVAETIARAS